MDGLKKLFSQLQLFELKYQKIDEVSISSFNIFSILRKSNDEVNLHSKFIYELLNPNGSHKQGRVFLDIFLREIGIEFYAIEIFREKFNIDILIKSKKEVIILENKIETTDHSQQLSSYLKTMQYQGYKDENIYIVYLTLFGDEPTETSIRDRVINISYSKHIKNWLESSIKEVAIFPTLRETLIQYLNLINKLTFQSHYKGFILEVKDFLLQNNNLRTILNITNSIIEAKIQIQLNFWKELLNNLTLHYPFKFYNYNGDHTIEESVNKYYKKQKNKRDYGYEYQLNDNLYFFIEIRHNIYYGFYFVDDENIATSQLTKLNNIKIDWEEHYWKYTDKRLDFEEFDSNVLDLINDEKRENDIKKISDRIIYLIKEYKKGETER